MNTPWVHSPFFDKKLKSKKLSPEFEKIAIDFNKKGYSIIRNFFNHETINELRSDIDKIGYNDNADINFIRIENRLQDFWKSSKNSKAIACNEKIIEILTMLYDRTPIPFQTLNFKEGSEQRAHSDDIHINTIPAKFMCGVWTPLEDITTDNGPVFFYPESHKIKEYNFSHFESELDNINYDNYLNFIEDIVELHNFKKEFFTAKKGDVLIWSSNLIHGGSKILDSNSTRYSQVTHYMFKDCIYYTPVLSNMVTNELFLRNDITNIIDDTIADQTFNGTPIGFTPTENNRFHIHRKKEVTNDENTVNEEITTIEEIPKRDKKIKKYLKKILNKSIIN